MTGVLQLESFPEIQATPESLELTTQVFKVQIPWDCNIPKRFVWTRYRQLSVKFKDESMSINYNEMGNEELNF